MKLALFVQARLTSKRFPNKILSKINNSTVIEILLKRLKKTHFEFFIEEPLIVKSTNDYDKDIFNITKNMNKKIENFIKIDSTCWLWTHDRWK